MAAGSPFWFILQWISATVTSTSCICTVTQNSSSVCTSDISRKFHRICWNPLFNLIEFTQNCNHRPLRHTHAHTCTTTQIYDLQSDETRLECVYRVAVHVYTRLKLVTVATRYTCIHVPARARARRGGIARARTRACVVRAHGHA